MEKEKILIAGGGLVGALTAAVFADEGHQVEVYEGRTDPRTNLADMGRSINLACSHRGRIALKQIGVEQECIESGVKLYARMIHKHNGEQYAIPYGRTEEHYILSISRSGLNNILLTAAEKRKNVKVYFERRVNEVDLDGTLKFKDGREAVGDVIIGADGAYSKVRAQMTKERFNYEQKYIPHGYKELTMKCVDGSHGVHRMPKNYLHIWPRHQFMLIALPNNDGSFTFTLFMPFELYEELDTQEGAIQFMRREFPDSVDIFGEENLRNQFGPNTPKALPLVTVKCSPHHLKNSLVVGDAAHAVVPFYGQGMNAGMEDIAVLSDLYKTHGSLKEAMKDYGASRPADAHAIADLALYNYIEMRDLVTSDWFLFRKRVDNLLTTLFPSLIKPLYEMTVFTPSISYSEVVRRNKRQSKVIDFGLGLTFVGIIVSISVAFYKYTSLEKYY